MTRGTQQPHAFTLIELLGVLSVLAILLAITLPVLQKSRSQAKIARVRSDILKIESALNLYKLDYGVNPTNTNAPGLIALGADNDFVILAATSAGPLSPSTGHPYLELRESQTIGSPRQFADPWKTPYWIEPTPTHNPAAFDIFSAGPDKNKQTEGDNITNWVR